MTRNSTRRIFLSALGSASLATLAGCSSDSESQAEGTATQTHSLESGTVSTIPLADIARILPQVDPLVMSAWKSPSGSSGGNPIEFDERTDTLRYNTVNSRLAPRAMATYLLSRETAPFVGPLVLGYLENGADVEWAAVIAGTSVMYADSSGLSTVRSRVDSVDVEYETITDSDSAVILRGSNGAVVGVTSNIFAFVPATDESIPFSPVSRVTALVETATDERESLPSQDPLLNTTLRHARLDGIVQLTHSQNAPLGEALPAHRRSMDGAAFSVTGSATGYEAARTAICQLDGIQEAPVSATATLGFPDMEDVDESDLIANVGNRGVGRKYVQDGDIVRVDCDYPQDALSAVLSDSSIGTEIPDNDNSNNTTEGGIETPLANYDFAFDSETDGSGTVTITHVAGDTIDPTNLYIRGDRGGTSNDVDDTWASLGSGGDVTAGDSVTIDVDNGRYDLRVVWVSDDGNTSKILSSSTGPDT